MAKGRLVTTQHVSRSATDREVSATFLPVATLITVYERMCKVSESKDVINIC